MRDYTHLERYLNTLAADIYGQPDDEGHHAMMEDIVKKWLPLLQGLESVLDVGCGQGQAIPLLQKYAARVEGVTLGEDVEAAQGKGFVIHRADMTFLPFPEKEFTLIFARHVLEHSPAPLLTLMEWRRVAQQWLLLVMPAIEHYGIGGRNHYSVMSKSQIKVLLHRSGWKALWADESEQTEYRWFCEKVDTPRAGNDIHIPPPKPSIEPKEENGIVRLGKPVEKEESNGE